MTGWQIALIVYVVLASATFLPVLRLFLRWVELKPGGPSFAESPHFSEEAKARLTQNFDRMRGTLRFWKTHAVRYRAFHVYALVWITISTVTVPVIAQAVGTDPWSRWFLSIVGAHAALLLATSRAFRIESNYRAFRDGESDFYDLYRRFLDRPQLFGESEDDQLAAYFERVDIVRQLVRSAETDNLPSVEEALRPPPRTLSE